MPDPLLIRGARVVALLALAAAALLAGPGIAVAAQAAAPSVRIAGITPPPSLVGDEVAVPGSGRATGRAGVPGAAIGPRSVLVLRLYYDAESTWPSTATLDSTAYSTADVQRRISGAATSSRAMYYAQSDGQVSLNGFNPGDVDVSDWLTFSGQFPRDASGTCNADAARAQALAEADTQGIQWRHYDHVVLLFPLLPSAVCSWAGLGQVGGSITWINGFYDSPGEEVVDSAVVAHELGHNLGVAHAASLACTQTTADPTVAVLASTACRLPKSASQPSTTLVPTTEYGDPFDMMGTLGYTFAWRGSELMSAWHRAQLLELPAASQQVVTVEGTYTLRAASAASGVRLLRIGRGSAATSTMTDLSLEYRPGGSTFDHWAADPLSPAGGVLVRLTPGLTTPAFSYLLDGTPETGQVYGSPTSDQFHTAWRDAALQPGRTLVDQPSGVRITVTGIAGGAATVELRGGPLAAAAAAAPTPVPTTAAAPAATPPAAPALPAATPAPVATPAPQLAVPSLLWPVARKGKIRLSATRKVSVRFPGAGRISASIGSRWFSARKGPRATFRLPRRAVASSTVRFRASGGTLTAPRTATLRIRRGVVRFTAR